VIARWEGAVFFGYYIAYTVFLLLDAANHPTATQYRDFMLIFVVPLTVLTIVVSIWRELRRRRTQVAPDQVSV
jgi:cation:H+ antiporter